jgi:hypothetical protein
MLRAPALMTAPRLFVPKAQLDVSQLRSGWYLPPKYVSVLKGRRKPPRLNLTWGNPSSFQDECLLAPKPDLSTADNR